LEDAVNESELLGRTKRFALRVIQLAVALPHDAVGQTIARQLVRAGTSVGANYRAACRGRSKAEFIAKLGNVEEEADESAYWMEIIVEAELMTASRVAALLDEAQQLTRIMSASKITSRRNTPPNRKSQIANRK
jgi:four helix bundle protein